ncbi:MAG: DNA/RNA nuclease SfsA [Clostridia bacterium]|nr:DNA/RNA nuclease SfsA [Clostridia bacterium]
MKLYRRVIPAAFLLRPNRFIARVATEDGEQTVHVKNTGRCRELLTPGARVWLAEAENPARKTRYDLVAAEKGSMLVNMDSQAPNRAAAEALPRMFPGVAEIRPEAAFGHSRLDFYAEGGGRKIYIEVKGCTLEEEGVALFPDAPTQRGVRHLQELERALEAGYEAALLMVIQMKGPRLFRPNRRTHPAFADALAHARDAGVRVLAYDCLATPDSLALDMPVTVEI